MEESNSSSGKNNKILKIALIVIAVIFGLVFLNRIFSNNNTSSTASTTPITGTLDINGVVPQDATVTLQQKESGSTQSYTEFKTLTNPVDGDAWSFDAAQSGKTYTIQAVVKEANGAEIVKSEEEMVTAPATDESLTVNLKQAGLTGEAVVSGMVVVNGYYPEGSTVSIMGRSENVAEFQTIVENYPAFSEKAVSYDKAVAGLEYEVVGYLYDASGTEIGKSEILTVVAPAKNEVLTINSTMSNETNPSPAAAKISGTIDLNGAAPNNSRIVILYSPMGEGNFQVALDNVNPEDGATWEWDGAQEATWYDMVAILKQRQSNGTDKDVAGSKEQTVAAPAINVMFSINTGIPIPTSTPSPSPTATQ